MNFEAITRYVIKQFCPNEVWSCWLCLGAVTVAVTVAVTFLSPLTASAQILNRPAIDVRADQLPSSYSTPIATSPVDAAQLRLRRADRYFLDQDDVLGVFVEGVLGEVGEAPPVQYPGPNSDLPPSTGFPVPVREDGTISMPLIEALYVRGLTINQVEQLLIRAYRGGDRPLLTDRSRILVSLIQKRTVSVYVVRSDQSQSASSPGQRSFSGNQAVNTRSDGSRRSERLQLPAGDNDLLNALTQTGGLPGVNAQSDVRVYRGQPLPAQSRTGGARFGQSTASFPRTGQPNYGGSQYATGQSNFTSVPTRQRRDHYGMIDQRDIRLGDGDVVVVQSRDTEVFYTGGLLGGGEFPIPRDRGLDVVEAVAIAGNRGASQGVGPLNLQQPTELLVVRRQRNGGQVTILVNLDRALADPSQRLQVAAGDVLVLRYSPQEQLRNIGIGTFNTFGIRSLLGR